MPFRILVERQLQSHDTVNFIIAGQSCSGKTTLANEISKMFGSQYPVTIVSQDDYFKDICDIPRSERGYFFLDSIEAFCKEEFMEDVITLFESGKVMMPRYDIATNTRIAKDKCVKLGKINVFEGLHTISILGNMKNSVKIFLNTDPSICKERRIKRDVQNQGIPEKAILEFWENSITPASELDVFPQMETADLILYRE